MIRMIIADDEPIIIGGVQNLLEWKKLGIEIVGTYSEGEAALDGILSLKPDIALLDIDMPGKTGIKILKELKELGSTTSVIFISGYQNFQYAQDAVKYGAVDYILKPIIEAELESALEKCISVIRKERGESGIFEKAETSEYADIPYERLAGEEDTTYLPAVIKIFYGKKERIQERRLIHFSVFSYLEQRIQEEEKGILFEKNGLLVAVLKESDKKRGKEFLYRLKEQAEQERHHKIGMIVGNVVSAMSQIPEQYAACMEKERYFYFGEQLPGLFLDVEEPVFHRHTDQSKLRECNETLQQALIKQKKEVFDRELQHLFSMVCVLSDGRKEDACFHLCTSIQNMEEKLVSMNIPGLGLSMKDLLAQSREVEDYGMLKKYFAGLFEQYQEQVRTLAKANEKTELIRAKEYIEIHYRENITLEVLAGEVHMNPYYFSAYFKKGTGKNFKDYLNEIRLNHAISLLVTTDKMTYEIAADVGYRDSRAFSDTFQRWYGETPSSYRKRVRNRDRTNFPES